MKVPPGLMRIDRKEKMEYTLFCEKMSSGEIYAEIFYRTVSNRSKG